jgi:hypothetical protein
MASRPMHNHFYETVGCLSDLSESLAQLRFFETLHSSKAVPRREALFRWYCIRQASKPSPLSLLESHGEGFRLIADRFSPHPRAEPDFWIQMGLKISPVYTVIPNIHVCIPWTTSSTFTQPPSLPVVQTRSRREIITNSDKIALRKTQNTCIFFLNQNLGRNCFGTATLQIDMTSCLGPAATSLLPSSRSLRLWMARVPSLWIV